MDQIEGAEECVRKRSKRNKDKKELFSWGKGWRDWEENERCEKYNNRKIMWGILFRAVLNSSQKLLPFIYFFLTLETYLFVAKALLGLCIGLGNASHFKSFTQACFCQQSCLRRYVDATSSIVIWNRCPASNHLAALLFISVVTAAASYSNSIPPVSSISSSFHLSLSLAPLPLFPLPINS